MSSPEPCEWCGREYCSDEANCFAARLRVAEKTIRRMEAALRHIRMEASAGDRTWKYVLQECKNGLGYG